MSDLFEHRRQAEIAAKAPLADRMRPRSLAQFVGQQHIVGPGRLLRRAIEADQISSLIFYGPPGTGKTTLARIIAGSTEAHFASLNAVLAGVKDIRAAVAEARERLGMHGRRTILFVDEVHRFNKAQQDALLPWVENGTVIFIGATTENPYFEVNRALVSRSRVFQLRPLASEDLRAVARMAVEDAERGYGRLDLCLETDAVEHLVNVSGGDARAVLNALELAVETTPPDAAGRIVIDLAVAEESIQRRAVLYDKEGDAHFDTISAFIKSVRGSDPDAALYWLARMVYAGEDPRFIFRRLLILAGEDIGLADPAATGRVLDCARAFDYVGLPEGQFHLAEATLYLATAPKSNSTLAYFDALEAVQRERVDEVPSHLKDGNRDAEAFGHGAGYLYPHAYRDHWVAQQYLPRELQGRLFYQPSDQGFERGLRVTVLRQREAQLAAMVEGEPAGPGEQLSFTGALAGQDRERWLARVLSGAGERLGRQRDRLLDTAGLARHDRVLDLRAGSGLLTWEAARRVPEGGVWGLARDGAEAAALDAKIAGLSLLEAPVILVGAIEELVELLALRGEAELRFDAIVGRNAGLGHAPEARLAQLAALLAPAGRLCLAEALPAAGSRPSDLLAAETGEPRSEAWAAWLTRVRAAEDALLAERPLAEREAGWLLPLLEAQGFRDARVEAVADETGLLLTQRLLERWLGPEADYAKGMAARLAAADLRQLHERLKRLLGGPARPWRLVTAYVNARASDVGPEEQPKARIDHAA